MWSINRRTTSPNNNADENILGTTMFIPSKTQTFISSAALSWKLPLRLWTQFFYTNWISQLLFVFFFVLWNIDFAALKLLYSICVTQLVIRRLLIFLFQKRVLHSTKFSILIRRRIRTNLPVWKSSFQYLIEKKSCSLLCVTEFLIIYSL